jgi:hypothetical protein
LGGIFATLTLAPSLRELPCGTRLGLTQAKFADSWSARVSRSLLVRVGYAFSTQLRGEWKISPGNLVNPTGTVTCGGALPATSPAARPPSQYDRAAEAPVPVSQYSVMLSRM